MTKAPSQPKTVAAVAAPGADFYVAGISDPPATWRLLGARGVSADDLRRRFGADFDVSEEQRTGARGPVAHFVLYHLVRGKGAPNEIEGSRTANGGSDTKGD